MNGAKHTNQINEIKYLQRNKGDRGLRSLEVTYKMTKIKLAAKLINGKDRGLDIPQTLHIPFSRTLKGMGKNLIYNSK